MKETVVNFFQGQKTRVNLINYLNSAAVLILIFSIVVFSSPPPLNSPVQPEQISGIGFFAAPGDCIHPEGTGSTFALKMTGDLQGCHYVFVEYANCSPSGVYMETGVETFVGSYRERFGTFRTTYKFEAKYQDCPNLVGEVIGRCQHPIIRGSGRGGFEGVTGRIDFKDDIQAGNFPYRGHLMW